VAGLGVGCAVPTLLSRALGDNDRLILGAESTAAED
jgi:hypothetical protein